MHRKAGFGRLQPIGAVHHLAERKRSRGGHPVPFPFCHTDPASAEGTTHRCFSPPQDTCWHNINVHEPIIERGRRAGPATIAPQTLISTVGPTELVLAVAVMNAASPRAHSDTPI